jgi:hypothetical protein
MQATTLIIAFIGSLLALFLQPAKAFSVYVAVLLWYPTYLTVQIGTVNFMAARIVAIVLLMKFLFNGQLQKNFIPNNLDKWVIFSSAIALFIPLIAWEIPKMKVLQNCSGTLTDSFLAYLLARICINNKSAITTALKWIGVILIPLAILGVVESVTGWLPYRAFQQYCPWNQEVVNNIGSRLGLQRAFGPFGHAIMFGTVFALFLPLFFWLRYERGYWRRFAYLLCVAAILGVFSSMSSGPFMSLIIIAVCLVLEHFKQWVKPLIISVILLCVIIGVISNRTFYHVLLTYINPIGGTSWHRAKLIDLAIENFGKWWFLGYRGQDPGWGPQLGNNWTDITNEYIAWGVQYGILGVIALCGVLIAGMRMVVSLHRSVKSPELKSLYWAMGSILVMLIITFNTCTFFSQTLSLFYCVLGIIGSSPNFALNSKNRLYYSQATCVKLL